MASGPVKREEPHAMNTFQSLNAADQSLPGQIAMKASSWKLGQLRAEYVRFLLPRIDDA